MRPMGPLTYEWSVYRPNRRLNANGHYLPRLGATCRSTT